MSRPPASPPPLPRPTPPSKAATPEAETIELDAGEETVLLATDLLKVHEVETLGVEAKSGPHASPGLVPQDVLEELHARGEIELQLPQATPGSPHADREFDQLAGELDGCVLEELAEHLGEAGPFNQLPRPALEGLAHAALRRTVSPGTLLFQENEPACSLFLVLEGELELLRGPRAALLRRAGPGEVLGLLGTLAAGRHVATARTTSRCVVCELPAEAIGRAFSPEGPVSRLRGFCQERLVELFLADRIGETDLVARGGLRDQFQVRALTAGETLIAPGEVLNALYLVYSGALQVRRRVVGQREQVDRIEAGQLCAVLSATTGTPCRFAVEAAEPARVARLPQQAFGELGRDHPALRALIARLPEQARRLDRDVYVAELSLPVLPAVP